MAAIGKVRSHDNAIFEISFLLADLFIRPIPNILPTETWVVDTGKPNLLAAITKPPVTKLAVNPCPLFILVIFLPIVTAIFFAFNKPPIAIAIDNRNILKGKENKLQINNNETNFGVSFNPLAKLTIPALV